MKIKSPRLMRSALSLLFLSAVSAQAALTVNFVSICDDEDPTAANLVKLQAVIDVYDDGGDPATVGVSISFSYAPDSVGANVHELYFQDSTGLLNGSGVVFSTIGTVGMGSNPINPGSLPCGSDLITTFAYDNGAPPPPDNASGGLTLGETLVLHFDGTDFADLNAAIAAFSTDNDPNTNDTPLIRIGAHIGSIESLNGESCCYLAVPGDEGPGIPEPASTALGLIGTILLLRRRRN